MKKLLTFLLLATSYLLLTVNVNAQQYGQYGPVTPSQYILIDKMVSKPNQSHTNYSDYEFVDNLSPSDSRFSAGNEVFFRLKVKNTSTIKIYNVTVKDFIPYYLEPISGPGNYDGNSRTITFNAGDFEADEEKIYFLKMQIFNQDRLPSDKGLFCLTNNAEARNDHAYDNDSSQLCIEKQVAGVPGTTTYIATSPKAGPEMGIALLGVETALIGLGLYLKKRV